MRNLLVACLLLAAGIARADVFVNEIKIDAGAIKNVTLSNVDVSFDARGDLHIRAPDYRVTVESRGIEPPLGGRHYYVAPSPQRHVGAAQWEVDVYVNRVFVHKFRSRAPDAYVEITRFLHAGDNQIHYVARKEDGDRRSTSADDVFELSVGTGHLADGGNLELAASLSNKWSAAAGGPATVDSSLRVLER
jgi:hypothetical protein